LYHAHIQGKAQFLTGIPKRCCSTSSEK